MNELYKKHRPKTLKEVVGQDSIIKSLDVMIKEKTIPHSILFSGPSGCGKTTIARILAKKLKCSKHDYKEVNSANFRGIDTVREINRQVGLAPIKGDCRVWVIDEVHKMTNDAQNGILKLLEDTPSHAYFFLCTTEPNKLIKAIHTRCTEMTVSSLDDSSIKKLLKETSNKESVVLSKEVAKKIIECSEGSPRKAMVFLHQVLKMDNKKDQLRLIQPPSIKTDSIKIARTLINSSSKWVQMSKVLKECDIKEAEGIRRLILAYSQTVMIKGGPMTDRAYVMIDAFSEHFFSNGSAGLVAACYEVITSE